MLSFARLVFLLGLSLVHLVLIRSFNWLRCWFVSLRFKGLLGVGEFASVS